MARAAPVAVAVAVAAVVAVAALTVVVEGRCIGPSALNRSLLSEGLKRLIDFGRSRTPAASWEDSAAHTPEAAYGKHTGADLYIYMLPSLASPAGK